LPVGLSRTEWKQATGGLLLTAGLVVAVMLAFDLAGIAMMGSAAFLLIYAAVNAGHLKVLPATGANAILVWLSLLTCLVMFAILCVYTYQQQPAALVALVIIAVASFAAEWTYRRWTAGGSAKRPSASSWHIRMPRLRKRRDRVAWCHAIAFEWYPQGGLWPVEVALSSASNNLASQHDLRAGRPCIRMGYKKEKFLAEELICR